MLKAKENKQQSKAIEFIIKKKQNKTNKQKQNKTENNIRPPAKI